MNKLEYPMVLVDLEYTAFGKNLATAWTKPHHHKEIVQIAAIKLNLDRSEIESLDIFVKPTINPKLSKRFMKLTNISQAAIEKQGIPFSDALKKFVEFIKNYNVCTFDGDYEVFEENCRLNKIDFPFKNNVFVRVCESLPKWGINREEYSSGTLYKAVGAKMDGHVHNALHDVRSMAVALKELIPRK